MKKLNLGCGRDIRKGYVNLDRVRLEGVDVVHDLNKVPYPFKEDEFDEIYCKHVLEHTDNLLTVMEEISRISKPGARIKVIAPYFAGQGAYNDPTHKGFFTYKTFDYLLPGGYYSKAVFRILRKRIFFFSSREFMKGKIFSMFPDFLINLSPMLYQRYLCWILPAAEVHYLLEVEK